jgi:hypothetical protein
MVEISLDGVAIIEISLIELELGLSRNDWN